MNRGTYSGDLAEIDFVKRFNSEKNNQDFDFYIKDLDIKELNDIYMVRVTTKQYSKLSNQTVMTRADTYLINSKDQLIKALLFENDFYLDEEMLNERDVNYSTLDFSGVSVKMSDSSRFQILKLTPESFKTLFGEYELGAGASIYCLREEEIEKNESVFSGWKTTKQNVINKYKNEIPDLNKLNDNISLIEQMKIYKELKEFSNKRIAEIIDNDKHIKEIIFNGYHIYDEPYSASYFYKGGKIQRLNYIPFSVTTGSGRSHGDFTIVLKPKNETIE